MSLLRLLHGLRMRGQCEGQPSLHRDSARVQESQLRSAHQLLRDEDQPRFARQARRKRHVSGRGRTRVRATGGSGDPGGLRVRQRASDAALEDRQALRLQEQHGCGRPQLLVSIHGRRIRGVSARHGLQSVHGLRRARNLDRRFQQRQSRFRHARVHRRRRNQHRQQQRCAHQSSSGPARLASLGKGLEESGRGCVSPLYGGR